LHVSGDKLIIAAWGAPGTSAQSSAPSNLVEVSLADKKIAGTAAIHASAGSNGTYVRYCDGRNDNPLQETVTRYAVLQGDISAWRTGGPQNSFGPACDGGYYLLALNAFCAAAFRRVPLGTARAFGATVDALGRAGFAVATLPPLRDVDDGGDVRWLCRCGGALGRAARAVRAPRVPATTRSSAATPPPFFAAIPARGPPVLPSIDL